jgi:hypothetical protein
LEVTEVSRVRRQRARIDELETAVRENSMLAADLGAYVGELEQMLVPLLERAAEEHQQP